MPHAKPRAVLALAIATAVFSSAGSQTTAGPPDRDDSQVFVLQARRRAETKEGSGRYHALTTTATWPAEKTAVVICDMWDKHWCEGATRRVAAMAGRMNEVVSAARAKGALVIHCPSNTMEYYKDTPQRLLAQSAVRFETKIPLERWCHVDEAREGKLPIDDSDGGCDCSPQCKNHKAWNRQIAEIKIEPGDAVTDSDEAFFLMKDRGIENVIVMGVHTNMCVLGRPFSIRQMVRQGQNVVLVRDLTDTMYNSRKSPFVHHSTGTDLVVEHIEKKWCPTITSVDLAGGKEFRFPDDQRPHVAMLIAEDEYKTEESLPVFAAKYLGREFRTTLVFGSETDRNDLPGLEAISSADVLLVSMRRRVLPRAQLELIRRHVEAGKSLVGIRTASHAFSLRADMAVPEGYEAWPTFDPDVLGGSYTGHHGVGPKSAISLAAGAAQHPIMKGVDLSSLIGQGSLYKVNPLAPSATHLLIGTIPDIPPEPVAWVNTSKYGGRVFYTSLGHIDDFSQEPFNRLLAGGVRWAAEARSKE